MGLTFVIEYKEKVSVIDLTLFFLFALLMICSSLVSSSWWCKFNCASHESFSQRSWQLFSLLVCWPTVINCSVASLTGPQAVQNPAWHKNLLIWVQQWSSTSSYLHYPILYNLQSGLYQIVCGMARKGLVVLVVVIRLIATGTNFSDTKWSKAGIVPLTQMYHMTSLRRLIFSFLDF